MQQMNHLIQSEAEDNQFLKYFAIVLGVLIIAGLCIFALGAGW